MGGKGDIVREGRIRSKRIWDGTEEVELGTNDRSEFL